VKIKDVHSLLKERLYKHWTYYKENGLWKTIPYILVRLKVVLKVRELKEFFYKKRDFIFFELNISRKNYIPENNYKIDLYNVKSEDIEKEKNYFDGWFNKRTALKRLRKDCVLLVKKIENRIIFFQWLELNNAFSPPIDLLFILPDHTAYKAYSYTLPEFRGRKIANKAKKETMKYLLERKYKNVLLIIAPENTPSIKVNKNSGFKEYQTIKYRKWLFLKYYRVKDWGTDRSRVFWRILRKDKTIWKTFSKIQQDK